MARRGRGSIYCSSCRSLAGGYFQFAAMPCIDCSFGASEGVRLRFGEFRAEEFGSSVEEL